MCKTKKAKPVKMEWVDAKTQYPVYKCPSCYVIYKGVDIGKNTTRFMCPCGQELIVSNYANYMIRSRGNEDV